MIPHTEIKSISTTQTTTMSISISKLKRCIILGPCFLAWYTYGYMVLWYSSNAYHIKTSISSYCSWRIHTTVILENIAYVEITCFVFYCMVYAWQRMILVAGLRYAPSLVYVVFLGGIYRSWVVTVYQRTTCCEHGQRMGSIALLT